MIYQITTKYKILEFVIDWFFENLMYSLKKPKVLSKQEKVNQILLLAEKISREQKNAYRKRVK